MRSRRAFLWSRQRGKPENDDPRLSEQQRTVSLREELEALDLIARQLQVRPATWEGNFSWDHFALEALDEVARQLDLDQPEI